MCSLWVDFTFLNRGSLNRGSTVMTNLFYDTLIENFVKETNLEVDHSMNGDGFKNCFHGAWTY